MEKTRVEPQASARSVRVTNAMGASPFLLVCDHASNHVPDEFADLGLSRADLSRHIAWDPGASPVAQRMSASLDAALIELRVSRLVIDCNRPLDAPDLIPAVSEATAIPGNAHIPAAARQTRIALAYDPFHAAIDAAVTARLAAGRETLVVSIHSFTPVYRNVARPWHIGIVHDDDRRLAAPLIAALERLKGVTVGDNQPYSPADRVYATLERHARSRGLPCAMIEIRNDQISATAGQRKWGDLLTGIFLDLQPAGDRKESRPLTFAPPAMPAN